MPRPPGLFARAAKPGQDLGLLGQGADDIAECCTTRSTNRIRQPIRTSRGSLVLLTQKPLVDRYPLLEPIAAGVRTTLPLAASQIDDIQLALHAAERQRREGCGRQPLHLAAEGGRSGCSP